MASGRSSRPKEAPQTLQRRATRRQVRSSLSVLPQFLQTILIFPESSFLVERRQIDNKHRFCQVSPQLLQSLLKPL